MRRTLPFAVALSALLFAAPAAPAAKIADTVSAGPIALAGNAVVYSVFRHSDQALRVRLARPGHVSKLVFSQRLFRGYGGEPTMDQVAASSRRVGVVTFQERGDIESSHYSTIYELWTGRPAGSAFKLVSTTRGRACSAGPVAVAVGDDALVSLEATCSERRVVVRDYARKGTPHTIGRSDRIKALTAAGHLAAWVQRDRRVNGHWTYSIVVYDLARGRVAHRISNGGWADYLSVQADGKVAGQSAQGVQVTGWYSATSSVRHEVPAGSVTPPSLGADKLLYSHHSDLPLTGDMTLALRDLGGNETVVATFPARQMQTYFRNATFDGRRVAFIRKGCTTNELWLLDANGPSYTPTSACPSDGSR